MKHTLYLFFFALAFLTSCHKEQAIMPNGLNGCDCAHEVSAAFFIEEMTTPNPYFVKYTDTDTIYANKNVRFRAKEDDAEYTWYIGAEILTSQEVTRYFSAALVGQSITVSLVVKKKPNTICFPNDDGKDSTVRVFYIASAFDNFDFYNNPQPRIEGTYRMKDLNKVDSIDIIIQAVPFFPPANLDKIVIINYNGLNDTIIFDGGGNYRQIFFDGPLYSDDSYWHFGLDNLYYINLSPKPGLEDPPFNVPSYFYKGRKLN